MAALTQQLSQETLPEEMRRLGAACLVSDYVRHWRGPTLAGFKQAGVFTVHTVANMAFLGFTFWFFLPENSDAELPLALVQAASLYMLPSVKDRTPKAPKPKRHANRALSSRK